MAVKLTFFHNTICEKKYFLFFPIEYLLFNNDVCLSHGENALIFDIKNL